jgi:hypothetical protein
MSARTRGLDPMRVLVFGGRDYRDRRRLYDVLDSLHARSPITVIIEGEMSGADRLAREWAESRGVDVDPYPADWDNIERPGAVVSGKPNFPGALKNNLMVSVRLSLIFPKQQRRQP